MALNFEHVPVENGSGPPTDENYTPHEPDTWECCSTHNKDTSDETVCTGSALSTACDGGDHTALPHINGATWSCIMFE